MGTPKIKEIARSKTVRIVTFATSIVGTVADVVSQTPHRELLPDVIEEQAGSFGIPCIGTLALNLIGSLFKLKGNME